MLKVFIFSYSIMKCIYYRGEIFLTQLKVIIVSRESLNVEKKVFPDVLDLLVHGWPTPIVKLNRVAKPGTEVWAKLESYNPFSKSIKDRAVWGLIKWALDNNVLKEALEEASSGNVAISLAAMSNVFNRKFRAYLPKEPARSVTILLRVLNAEHVITDHETIDPVFWNEVKKHAESIGATNLNQFENDANFEIHYKTTAKELLEQIEVIGKKPDFIIAGTGTSGHISAITKRIREKYGNAVKIYAVQPAKGSKIPGIKRIETKPKWLFKAEINGIVDISWEEAVEGVLEVARKEGILIGLSSGAVFKTYEKFASKEKGLYILIFPDDAFKYTDHFEKYFKMQESSV